MAKINLRDILKKKGISNKELAKMLGVTPSAVSQMLSNPYPSMQQIGRIADVLNMDLVEMFSSNHEYVSGYIETGSIVHSIKNREQFFDVMDAIPGIVRLKSYPTKELYCDMIKIKFQDAIINNKSLSKIYRYGISQIISLVYDAESKNIFLSQCDGICNSYFTAFDTKKYIKSENVTDSEMEEIVKEIMNQIELIANKKYFELP